MYNFRITKEEKGYKLELKGIKMLVEGYEIVNDKHILVHPEKAIAYFDTGSSVYGVVNEPTHFLSAEEFQDAMEKQFDIFKK